VSAPQSHSDLLDPAAISRAEHLGFIARRIVEGYRVGEHRSPLRGFAIEFSQHREYTAGDDPRHLDWKVLGRSDRYYIKQYEQDTNFIAHLLVDGSESMNYGSGKLTKLHYAKTLAACLGYIVLQQRDAVALALFDDALRDQLPRTDNFQRIHHIAARLAAFEASRPGNLGVCLQLYAAQIKSRGIVVLISDLLDDPAALRQALRRVTLSGSEAIVFQVLDHQEINFKFDGMVKFLGLEGAGEKLVSPQDLRKAYLKEFEAHQREVRKTCEQSGVHHILCDTSKPLHEALTGYLSFRSKT
jgi:uncharacterized protein (DUF58 family)